MNEITKKQFQWLESLWFQFTFGLNGLERFLLAVQAVPAVPGKPLGGPAIKIARVKFKDAESKKDRRDIVSTLGAISNLVIACKD